MYAFALSTCPARNLRLMQSGSRWQRRSAVVSAITGASFGPEKRAVRFKSYRLPLLHLFGRMSRTQSALRLRCGVSERVVTRVSRMRELQAAPTQRNSVHPAGARLAKRSRQRLSLSKQVSQRTRHPQRVGLARTEIGRGGDSVCTRIVCARIPKFGGLLVG